VPRERGRGDWQTFDIRPKNRSNISDAVARVNGTGDSRVKGEFESLVLSQDFDGCVYRQDGVLTSLWRLGFRILNALHTILILCVRLTSYARTKPSLRATISTVPLHILAWLGHQLTTAA
jgi:hypothetical protein